MTPMRRSTCAVVGGVETGLRAVAGFRLLCSLRGTRTLRTSLSRLDAEIHRIGQLPVDQQPAAWGALDESIMTDYYPIVITDYRGDAMLHGSKVGGMNNDASFGGPTWKDIHVVQ